MIPALLRLFALRPLFTIALFGVPLIVLIAVGLMAILALKVVVFVLLPAVLIVWALRSIFGRESGPDW